MIDPVAPDRPIEFNVELLPSDLPRIAAWFAIRKRDYWILSGLLWLVGGCGVLLWLFFPRLAFSTLATMSLAATPLVHMLGVPLIAYSGGRSAFQRMPEYERRFRCRLDAEGFEVANAKSTTRVARDIVCAAELRDAFLLGSGKRLWVAVPKRVLREPRQVEELRARLPIRQRRGSEVR